MLPVSASSRWWMRNASCRSGARRPVTGSWNQSGSALSARGAPRTVQVPASTVSAAADQRGRGVGSHRRRGPMPAAATTKARSGRTPRRQWGRLAGPDLATCPGPATPDIQGAVDHLGRRHPAEPSQVPAGAGAAHQVTGLSCRQTAPDGERCPGGRHQGLQRDRHRGAGADGVDEALQLRALTLVLAREHPAPALPLGRPHGDPLEVVQPSVAAVTDDVQGLLRETRAAVGDVGDRRHGPVGEAQGGVDVRARPHRVHLDRVVPDQGAQRVDEMTALAGEPGSFQLLVEVPAARVQAAGVDQVARRHRTTRRTEAFSADR